jgi:hypothetical protein
VSWPERKGLSAGSPVFDQIHSQSLRIQSAKHCDASDISLLISGEFSLLLWFACRREEHICHTQGRLWLRRCWTQRQTPSAASPAAAVLGWPTGREGTRGFPSLAASAPAPAALSSSLTPTTAPFGVIRPCPPHTLVHLCSHEQACMEAPQQQLHHICGKDVYYDKAHEILFLAFRMFMAALDGGPFKACCIRYSAERIGMEYALGILRRKPLLLAGCSIQRPERCALWS